MATSSSDNSSTTPKDLNLSSLMDSGSRLSPNKQKCQLCCNLRKKFYCKECVNNGQIHHSKLQTNERYADKLMALEELENNKNLLEKKCMNLLESRQIEDALQTKIRQSKDRTRLIQLAVEEKKKKKCELGKKLSEMNARLRECSEKFPQYKRKVEDLENCIPDKYENINCIRHEIKIAESQIKKIAKRRIQELHKFIFPITKVEPQIESSTESSDMISALADACQPICGKDSWEYTDNSSELQYAIVAPTLPASGSYSLYHIWASHNKDNFSGANNLFSVEQNPALNINAALTYTVQLIQVLAFYLNIHLRYKMAHSDFCVKNLNEKQFNRRVARINANILHLCFTQNVDLNLLNSTETINNLLHLIDTDNPDLGRQGPIEVDSEKASLLEKPLTEDLKNNEDSDSDDGSDSLHGDWEAVPHFNAEISAGPVNVQSSQMINTQQASSMAGGLVNSIASIWRGFTKR